MTDHNIYIILLKREVAGQYGQVLRTTNDFDRLRDDIIATTSQSISLSTLKRLWGYVEGWQVPRRGTLDVLARYLGYSSFEAFVDTHNVNSRVESDFPEAITMYAHEIPTGTDIELLWLPDRVVRLRHKGNGVFIVTANSGSKLRKGWLLSAQCFVSGQPLYATVTDPATPDSPRPYLAGKTNGISFRIISDSVV